MIVRYLDDNGQICDEAQATYAMITEYDEDNNPSISLVIMGGEPDA
jgi:hypothetical protein